MKLDDVGQVLRNARQVFQKYYILVFKFDSKFYLACNPDIKIAGVNPKIHFLNYGFREQRIYSIKECNVVLLKGSDLLNFKNIFGLPLDEITSSSIHFSTIFTPWRQGCWGRPSQFIHVRITKKLLNLKQVKNVSTILYTKKGLYENVFLLKY